VRKCAPSHDLHRESVCIFVRNSNLHSVLFKLLDKYKSVNVTVDIVHLTVIVGL